MLFAVADIYVEFNLTEENLTKDKCDVIFNGVNRDTFLNDFEELSLRKMKKKYNTTKEIIERFYKKCKN